MAGKSHIVDSVASQVEGLTKKQTAEVVDAVFEAIAKNLKKGERVVLPGFGSFSVTERAARKGRNPATGQTIRIPATRSARFKAGRDLKDQMSGARSRSIDGSIDGNSTTDPPRS